MAQKIYGIDFGTDTIKIYKKGQGIILIEKNVVSTVGKERRPVAIGEEAYEMFEKTKKDAMKRHRRLKALAEEKI